MNYIEHHGIKGMKWGVRRYQNPDGSLTAAGKKRYSSSEVREARKSLPTERANLTKLEKRKSRIEGETDYLDDVYEARREAIDSWDEVNSRPLSKKESDALWSKYQKKYDKALKNNKEYQSVLNDYNLQKTKVSELEKMAATKTGEDFMDNTLLFAGSLAAAVFVSSMLTGRKTYTFHY